MNEIVHATSANSREIIEGVIVTPNSPPLSGALARPGAGRISTPDLMEIFLRDKHSDRTKAAYEGDLRHHYLTFREGTARFARSLPCTRDEIVGYLDAFISWPRHEMAFRLIEYKALMQETHYADATVARRLRATNAFIHLAYRFNRCETDGRGLVDIEKVRSYRDTHGISPENTRELFTLPAKAHGLGSLRALRDEAMLRLMAQAGLRRAEVLSLDVGDFSLQNNTVKILGKGRGTQKEILRVPLSCSAAVAAYLQGARKLVAGKEPIFCSLDHRFDTRGNRLNIRTMNKIVGAYGARLGIDLRPHMLRHTFGTQLSKKTGGDVPAVQKAMRHADANTTLRYIENAKDLQGQMVDLLTEVYD